MHKGPLVDEQGNPHYVDVHVGRMIRAIRLRLDVSQEGLANELGLSFQQVQKYERGVNRVSGSKLYEIARFFGVPVGAFFEGLDGANTPEDQQPVRELLAMFATAEGAELAR